MPRSKPQSALRAPYDFDRQNNAGMELEFFKSFQHFEPDILSGEIIAHADRGPGPDFRVRVGNKVIGVEVRRVCTPLGSPDIESTQDGILDEARCKAERLNLPPALVTLFFNLRRPLRLSDRIRIADAVMQVVADNMPANGDMAKLERRPGQPTEVDLILVSRQYPRELGRWRAGDEFLASERNISGIVQEAITAKVNRLPTYVSACDECWLLLVADSARASGKLALGEADRLQCALFSSRFTRTYILDFGRGHLYRLNEDGRFTTTKPSRVGA